MISEYKEGYYIKIKNNTELLFYFEERNEITLVKVEKGYINLFSSSRMKKPYHRTKLVGGTAYVHPELVFIGSI